MRRSSSALHDSLLLRGPYTLFTSSLPHPRSNPDKATDNKCGTRKGKTVPLSAREFQLLRFFVGHPGATLSREVLLKEIWGYNTDALTRTVDVHVASLRQKLESDPRRPAFIATVLGLGYEFSP
jgi:DNA-binding response OmpR family regulator